MLLTFNEASFFAMLKEGLRMSQHDPSLDDLEIRILGLNPRQIAALMSFYQTMTGLDPRKITLEPVPQAIADPDYKSPGLPPGYETVVGYLSEYEPRLWELLDFTAEATQRDGWWLKHKASERRLSVVKVEACPWLIRQGIFEVNAYPLELLRERFSK